MTSGNGNQGVPWGAREERRRCESGKNGLRRHGEAGRGIAEEDEGARTSGGLVAGGAEDEAVQPPIRRGDDPAMAKEMENRVRRFRQRSPLTNRPDLGLIRLEFASP